MQIYKFALPALIALAGCDTTPSTPTAPATSGAVSAKVAAECTLLESAYVATKAKNLPAPSDIIVGCPGRVNLAPEMGRLEGVAAFRRAAAAPLPAAARDSRMGKILYQRMISRGVPLDVAVLMAATPEFAKAVAAYA